MFIVTKLNVFDNTTQVIKVVDDGEEVDKLIAYEALLQDALKNTDHYSIKNINGERVEVYIKSMFGSYLNLVYELHEIKDEDEDEGMKEIN